jgi:F420-dependent oxidoreductase-like protein
MQFAISIGGPRRGTIEDDVELVQFAERLGIDYAWAAEAWGRDAVTPLAYLAACTERIKLGTGIMQISARAPAMMAMTALNLAALSNNRFVLGLGVSGPQVVEGLHGQRFQPAFTRLRETVQILRKAFAGEKLEYHGRAFELPLPGGEGKALRIDQPANPDIPIFLATLGPKALQFTGAEADGWLGTSFTPDRPQAHMQHLRDGAAQAGRDFATLACQVQANLAIGDDVEALIASMKPGVAFQMGAMGSAQTNFYNDAVCRAGHEEDARAIQALWVAGKRDEAVARVPDDMVLKFGLVGNAEMVRERLAVYRDAGITCINLRTPALDGPTRMGALEQAMDVLRAG